MNGSKTKYKQTFGSFIFLSRWLQAPLYCGLIIAQAVYVYRFLIELWHLIGFSLLNHEPPAALREAVTDTAGHVSMDMLVMLSVLGLIDVVMIANLLIMVIVGGYETFVSRLNLANHPDQPEWLSHVNAGVLKVKLATALIGISSIHLLKTFISVDRFQFDTVMWQVTIHVVFLGSAVALAWIDRLTFREAGIKH
ncbi:MAG: YqhA family protein [Verrucomicrobia bacterium]|nr:YqhA family protein [Verrucomicrobiota bacterium]